ncbi:50S ribosomal protein L32e [Candidatus Woesearchaeota archaeon]|nr:50S ribosomal protein L32e [Candidatus Woesearchaeota archaeon]
MIDKLLETRKRIKSRKPDFIMQDQHKRKELKKRWRKPKGMHSKMRMRIKGKPKSVEIGYSSPRLVKHLDRKGRRRILIGRPEDLTKLDKNKDAAMIKHGVGIRKKIEILKAAAEKGITVINLTEEKLNRKIELKKKDKQAAKEKEPAPSPAPEKKEAKTEEEEKKEKDKILTKREI